MVGGEVDVDVGGGPVLEQQRADEQDRDRQQVVVVHGVEVLEVGELDALAHAEHVRRAAEAVEEHPQVARVEGGDLRGRLRVLQRRLAAADGVDRRLDVRPGRDHGREHHEPEGEESHPGDAAAKPEHFAVRDEDDGQVLEDGVDGDREELERFRRGVDHAD